MAKLNCFQSQSRRYREGEWEKLSVLLVPSICRLRSWTALVDTCNKFFSILESWFGVLCWIAGSGSQLGLRDYWVWGLSASVPCECPLIPIWTWFFLHPSSLSWMLKVWSSIPRVGFEMYIKQWKITITSLLFLLFDGRRLVLILREIFLTLYFVYVKIFIGGFSSRYVVVPSFLVYKIQIINSDALWYYTTTFAQYFEEELL